MDEKHFVMRAENSNKSSAGPLKLLFSGDFFLLTFLPWQFCKHVLQFANVTNAGTLYITLVMFRHRDHAVTFRK